jgi:hypothetical protein
MTAITASLTRIASTADGGRLLRVALRVDALASGVLGLAGLVAAPAIAELTGAPAPVLRGVGGFLVLFAIALLVLAARVAPPVAGSRAVVVVNVCWVLGSIAVALLAPLTVLGTVLVLVQALGVALFADLQWLGIRRATA